MRRSSRRPRTRPLTPAQQEAVEGWGNLMVLGVVAVGFLLVCYGSALEKAERARRERP